MATSFLAPFKPASPRLWAMNLPTKALAVLAALAIATIAAAQDGIRVLRDLPYGSDRAQRVDVYLPDPKPANAPIIAMVHGGAWAFGDKSNGQVVVNKSRRWVPHGVVFVSINNRLVPNANPVEQAEDVARAVAFIQKEAKGWGADPAKLVLMGHSAGAHLVALLAADPARAKRLGAVAGHRGPRQRRALDVPQIMENRHVGIYDRAFGSYLVARGLAAPCARVRRDPDAGGVLLAAMVLLLPGEAVRGGRRESRREDRHAGTEPLAPRDQREPGRRERLHAPRRGVHGVRGRESVSAIST